MELAPRSCLHRLHDVVGQFLQLHRERTQDQDPHVGEIHSGEGLHLMDKNTKIGIEIARLARNMRKARERNKRTIHRIIYEVRCENCNEAIHGTQYECPNCCAVLCEKCFNEHLCNPEN